MATFRNPVIKGFHPDPSACRVGQEPPGMENTRKRRHILMSWPILQSKENA